MRFEILNQETAGRFLDLYESAFPEEERRPYRDVSHLLKFIEAREGKFQPFSILDDRGEYLGFITCWNFPGFIYIEHFAVLPEMRGQNIGSRVLALLADSMRPEILLEVEMPGSDEARRRIGFYERNGFCVRSEFKYIQPPYSQGLPSLQMLLMTHGDVRLDSPADIAEMMHDVYNVPFAT